MTVSALASGDTLRTFLPVGSPLKVRRASNSMFSGKAFVRSIYIALRDLSSLYTPSFARLSLEDTP